MSKYDELKVQLEAILRSFMFEPNTPETRDAITDSYYEYLNGNTLVQKYDLRFAESQGPNDVVVEIVALLIGQVEPINFVIRLTMPTEEQKVIADA
jgi:hypothetical protein